MRIVHRVSTRALITGVVLLGALFLVLDVSLSAENRYSAGVERPEARVLFVGDLFFDRRIRHDAEVHGADYLFSCIDPLLRSADMVVGNLEGPITPRPSVSYGTEPGSPQNFVFSFPTTTAELLVRHNFGAVNLGNNHTFTFGYNGLSQTHHYLEAAGLPYFGGVVGDEPVYETNEAGVPLSFVSYNAFGGEHAADVAKMVAQEKAKGRVVVVFAHWGEEYSKDISALRPVAQLFAKSGAAAVLGSHPHVVALSEEIGTTTVYYSLGNFIFDQYFSQDVMHGLAVMLIFDRSGVVSAKEYPVVLEKDGQTCPTSAQN